MYIGYFLLAFLFAILLTAARIDRSYLNQNEKGFIAGLIGWTLVVYALFLSFSIGSFYSRYISIRDTIANEVSNLQIIYRSLKSLRAPDYVIQTIRTYAESVLEYGLPALARGQYSRVVEETYRKMDVTIIDYLNENREQAGLFTTNIMTRMSTDVKMIQIVKEINASKHYIHIIWLLLSFVLIPLWLLSPPDKMLQFASDVCILEIILSGVYLIQILNNPFSPSPVSLNLSGYQLLLDEMNSD
jgi:TM2 domain-containing membrane protein YozV